MKNELKKSKNCRYWYRGAWFHRLDGPALEYIDGEKLYYLDGWAFTRDDWEKELEKWNDDS